MVDRFVDRCVVVQGADYVSRLKADTANSAADAKTSADRARGSVIEAAAQVQLAGVQANRASGFANTASLYASETGADRQAIQDLIGDIPTDPTLRLLAVSRAVVAGYQIAGRYEGEPCQLFEPGHGGGFRWRTGDQSARFATITVYVGDQQRACTFACPTGQSLAIAPTEDPTGKSGAWVRDIPGGIAFASWAGVVADGTVVHDGVANDKRLSWLLNYPGVTSVIRDAGVTAVSGTIIIGSGRSLGGADSNSPIRAIGWNRADQNNGFTAHSMITTTYGAYGVRLRDVWTDGNKSGFAGAPEQAGGEIHGIAPNDFIDFEATGCRSTNISGYALVFFGGKSGVFRDCETVNANVPMEATNGVSGWLFDNCTYEAGDNDIVPEGILHALNGAKYGGFRRCRAVGTASAAGAYVVVNAVGDYGAMPGIFYDHCDVTVSNGSLAIAIIESTGQLVPCEVTITGGSYKCPPGGGFSINGGAVLHIKGASIQGGTTWASIFGSDVFLTDTTMRLSTEPGTTASFFGNTDATAQIVIDGGKIIGNARGENSLAGQSNNITILGQPDLSECPTDNIPIMGKGHKLTRFIPAADTNIAATAGNFHIVGSGGSHNLFQFVMLIGGVYEVTVDMVATTSATGIAAWLNAQGSFDYCFGKIDVVGVGGAPSTAVYDTASDDFVSGHNGLTVPAADNTKPVHVTFKVRAHATAPDAKMATKMFAYADNMNSPEQDRTLFAGSSITVEQIA